MRTAIHLAAVALVALLPMAPCTPLGAQPLRVGQGYCTRGPDPDPGLAPPQVCYQQLADVQTRAHQDSILTLAVAISGGGHRAANFATGVFLGLEKIGYGSTSNMLNEVDFFSTVSGGGFAAAAYISERYVHRHDYHPSFSWFEEKLLENCEPGSRQRGHLCLRESLRRSYERGLVGTILNVPGRIIGRTWSHYLESEYNRNLLGVRKHPGAFAQDHSAITLSDILPDSGTTPLVPFWVTNATVFRNGAIFPFAPSVLERYAIIAYSHEYRRRDLDRPGDLPVSVGVKASSAFPVLISPTSLVADRPDSRDRVLLIDGGVADNLGLATALHFLTASRQTPSRPISPNGEPPRWARLLFLIDVYNEDVSPYQKRRLVPVGPITTARRVMDISLDSSHGRMHTTLMKEQAYDDHSRVVFDFATLVDTAHYNGRKAVLADERFLGICARIFGVGSLDEVRELLAPQRLFALHAQVTRVGTRLSIGAGDQIALLDAGRSAVCLNVPAMMNIISFFDHIQEPAIR